VPFDTLIVLATIVGVIIWVSRSRPCGGHGGGHRRHRRGHRHGSWNWTGAHPSATLVDSRKEVFATEENHGRQCRTRKNSSTVPPCRPLLALVCFVQESAGRESGGQFGPNSADQVLAISQVGFGWRSLAWGL